MAIDSWDTGYGPEALIGAGSALLTPRSQGGGFAAVGPALINARKMHQDSLLQKLYRDAQVEQLTASTEGRKAQTAQLKQQQEARRLLESAILKQLGINQDGASQPASMVPIAPGNSPVRTLSGVNPSSGGPPMPGPDDRPAINAMPTSGQQQRPRLQITPELLLLADRAGVKRESLESMATADTIGMPEMKDRREFAGPNGEPMIQEIDKFGRAIGDPYRKPVESKVVGGGDRNNLINPFTNQILGSLGINQSPDSKASNQVAIRGQNLVNARAQEQNAIQAGVRQAADEKSRREDADSLRKELYADQTVKAYKEIVPVQRSVTEAIKRDTSAADINLIYGASKIFDPTSVVREGEYATVAASAPPAERLQGLLSFLQGGGKLTAATRQALADEVNSRAYSVRDSYQSVRDTYGKIAAQRGHKDTEIFQGLPELGSPISGQPGGFNMPPGVQNAAMEELKRRQAR